MRFEYPIYNSHPDCGGTCVLEIIQAGWQLATLAMIFNKNLPKTTQACKKGVKIAVSLSKYVIATRTNYLPILENLRNERMIQNDGGEFARLCKPLREMLEDLKRCETYEMLTKCKFKSRNGFYYVNCTQFWRGATCDFNHKWHHAVCCIRSCPKF